MLRFLLVFPALLGALFVAELTPPVQQALVLPWTEALAHMCAAAVTFFDGHASASGRVLASTSNGFAISIESGCNGVEAGLILIAAIAAFRAPWRAKVTGIAFGLVTVQALNIVRVVSLFYLGQWSPRAFEWAHLYLWQALIMLDVLVVWLLWLRWISAPGASPAVPPPEAAARAPA
jgi:exosortase H (IPTLxxWG-CTERM-specific)